MSFENEKEIMIIAKAIASIVPNCCGVTLGGSRAHNLNDQLSDVEMYFYSLDCIPSEEKINQCLCELGAKHKRCDKFLWNEYPWGPHSFFMIDDLYFEIGYRIVRDIDAKLDSYLKGNVAPTTDCHDLGLGYVYSGLAASVCSEQILLSFNSEIDRLKNKAEGFPYELKKALKLEYLQTAQSLIEGKLLNAAKREDIFFYDVLASRIIRSLMIIAFAITNTHFPGDKWNELLLLRSNWNKSQDFIDLIKVHCGMSSAQTGLLMQKWNILKTTYQLVEEEFK